MNLSTPEAGARSVYGLVANAASKSDAAQRLSALAIGASAKLELDGTRDLFDYTCQVDTTLAYDQLYSRGVCQSEARGALVRVRCEVPEGKCGTPSASGPRAEGLALESLGSIKGIAHRAWSAAHEQQLAAAEA